MAKNAIHGDPGTIVHAPAANTASGVARGIGALVGVAINTVAATVPGAFAVRGVFTLPKATGFAPAQGTPLVFRPSNQTIVATATAGDIVNGCVAWKGAASGDTSIEVLLCPGSGSIE